MTTDKLSTNTWNITALNVSHANWFIQVYLQASEVTNSHFHDNNLMETVLNLFAAGTDTTATTLRWALLLMAKYPKIQGKEQKSCTSQILKHMIQTVCFTNTTIIEIRTKNKTILTAAAVLWPKCFCSPASMNSDTMLMLNRHSVCLAC